MADSYKHVYVKSDIPEYNNNEIEINPEYVYLTIPADWVCLYHKLLGYLADFGETAIKDCQAACKGQALYIIQCWNMFQSAIACRTIGDFEKAELFIKYIDAQLNNIYKSHNTKIYCGEGEFAITPDGKLKARVSCKVNNVKFYVDKETGKLYEKYIEETDKEVYSIEDDNLIIEDEE